jgi:ketosteroid isomerase-like protein
MNQDINSFVSLHAADLVRAEVDKKQVMNLEAYRRGMESSWPRWKESIGKNKESYTFELRFLERICNGELAYEIGYFRNEETSAEGVMRESYGKFYVVLRKEYGIWKILVDADSKEAGTITSEMFMAAKPLAN